MRSGCSSQNLALSLLTGLIRHTASPVFHPKVHKDTSTCYAALTITHAITGHYYTSKRIVCGWFVYRRDWLIGAYT